MKIPTSLELVKYRCILRKQRGVFKIICERIMPSQLDNRKWLEIEFLEQSILVTSVSTVECKRSLMARKSSAEPPVQRERLEMPVPKHRRHSIFES